MVTLNAIDVLSKVSLVNGCLWNYYHLVIINLAVPMTWTKTLRKNPLALYKQTLLDVHSL